MLLLPSPRARKIGGSVQRGGGGRRAVKSTNHRINQNNDGHLRRRRRWKREKRKHIQRGVGCALFSRAIRDPRLAPPRDKFVRGVNNRGCFCDLMTRAAATYPPRTRLCVLSGGSSAARERENAF